MTLENPHQVACTAAIDLLDVRCASGAHPHRGAHHATGQTVDGDRWSLFWHTPDGDNPPEPEGTPLNRTEALPRNRSSARVTTP